MINTRIPIKFNQDDTFEPLDPEKALSSLSSVIRRTRIGITDCTVPSNDFVSLAGAWLLSLMGYTKMYWYKELYNEPVNSSNIFSVIYFDDTSLISNISLPESTRTLYNSTGFIHGIGEHCIYVSGKDYDKATKYILANMKIYRPDIFERFKDNPTIEEVYKQFREVVNKHEVPIYEDKEEKLKEFFKDSLCQDKKDAIASIESNIKACRDNIANYIEKIIDKQGAINEYIERINCLRKNKFDTNQSAEELIQFLADNEIIEDVQIYGAEYIMFQFTTDLEYEDLDEFRDNVTYSGCISNNYRDILLAVAESDRFKIRSTTRIILKKNNFKALDYSETTATIFENSIPNPHLMGYNCFGNHYGSIAAFMQNYDYVNAISEMIEAGSVINTYDSTVVEKMTEYIDDSWGNKVVIDLETGELLSMEEAYEKLGTEK